MLNVTFGKRTISIKSDQEFSGKEGQEQAEKLVMRTFSEKAGLDKGWYIMRASLYKAQVPYLDSFVKLAESHSAGYTSLML